MIALVDTSLFVAREAGRPLRAEPNGSGPPAAHPDRVDQAVARASDGPS